MGLRHSVASLVGTSALLAGLVACASTIAPGTAQYVGAGATQTTQTTQTTTETTTESTDPPSTEPSSTPGPSADELTACFLIPLSDLDAFSAFNDLAGQPADAQTQKMRNSVAALFDKAQKEVQGYIDPLPDGPIKDAAVAYRQAQVEVRDKLNAGDDVNTQIILDAQDVLQSACGTA